MDNNTKLMSIVLNLDEPLSTIEYPSDIIIYNTFSTAQTNTTIWTPSSGKSIFLTGFLVSASVPLVINLNRENNTTFMSIILTTSLATCGESFPSPIKFVPDEVISITTNVAGTTNITLIGYEL